MDDDAPRCTKSLFGAREVCQPRFQVGDVAVCEACATFAVPEGLGEPVVTTPLKPFACGIATLAASGLCADVFHATAPDGCAPIDGEAALRKAIDQQRAAPAPNAPKIAGVLQRCAQTRAAHEDAALLNDVRGLLPLDLLRARAAARSDPVPDGDDKAAAFAAATARHYGSASSEPSDALLRELANYFKGPQFFTWVKAPQRGHGHADRGGKAQAREPCRALPLPLRRRGAVPPLQLPPDFIVRDADGPLRRVRQRLRALPAGLRLRGALRLGLDGPRLGRGLVG